MDPETLTVRQLAERTGLSRVRVRRIASERPELILDRTIVGKRILFKRCDTLIALGLEADNCDPAPVSA